MKTVYLAGPMKGLTWDDAGSWRKDVNKMMPSWMTTLSPLRGKTLDIIDKHPVIENSYEANPITSVNGINMRDYNDVKRADAVIANLYDVNTKSVGTIMEIAWCRALGTPCIIVVPEDYKGTWVDHPMLLEWGAVVVHSIESAVQFVIALLGDDGHLEYLASKDRNKDRTNEFLTKMNGTV